MTNNETDVQVTQITSFPDFDLIVTIMGGPIAAGLWFFGVNALAVFMLVVSIATATRYTAAVSRERGDQTILNALLLCIGLMTLGLGFLGHGWAQTAVICFGGVMGLMIGTFTCAFEIKRRDGLVIFCVVDYVK